MYTIHIPHILEYLKDRVLTEKQNKTKQKQDITRKQNKKRHKASNITTKSVFICQHIINKRIGENVKKIIYNLSGVSTLIGTVKRRERLQSS